MTTLIKIIRTTNQKKTIHLKQFTRSHKCSLKNILHEAEKLVGYSTSFLNLRWLLSDELANIAMHFRKLIGSRHPMIDTARKLFIANESPPWGLIILLVSKVCGAPFNATTEKENDKVAGVLHSQRAIAEITEMLRTSNVLHKSIAKINNAEDKNDLVQPHFGNKMLLLSGDYLLSRCFHELSCLRNQSVNLLISSALRDISEATTIGLWDKQDIAGPYKPLSIQKTIVFPDHLGSEPYNVTEALGYPRAEWTMRNLLGGATLLGKACQSVLKLAGHSMEIERLGFLFGKNVALAWQARLDQEAFLSESDGNFSLVSAPVMLHLERKPSSYKYIEDHRFDTSKINYDAFKTDIERGDGLKIAKLMQRSFALEALKILEQFPISSAKNALRSITNILI